MKCHMKDYGNLKAILHYALGLHFDHWHFKLIEKEPNASSIGYITRAFACVLLAFCLRFACVLLALGLVLLALGRVG